MPLLQWGTCGHSELVCLEQADRTCDPEAGRLRALGVPGTFKFDHPDRARFKLALSTWADGVSE